MCTWHKYPCLLKTKEPHVFLPDMGVYFFEASPFLRETKRTTCYVSPSKKKIPITLLLGTGFHWKLRTQDQNLAVLGQNSNPPALRLMAQCSPPGQPGPFKGPQRQPMLRVQKTIGSLRLQHPHFSCSPDCTCVVHSRQTGVALTSSKEPLMDVEWSPDFGLASYFNPSYLVPSKLLDTLRCGKPWDSFLVDIPVLPNLGPSDALLPF